MGLTEPTSAAPGFPSKVVAKATLCAFVAAGLVACKKSTSQSNGRPVRPLPNKVTTAPSILPPVPASPNDLFEDVTAKVGITFAQQFCDEKIANIIESNGSGAAWLDYDGDGFMDVYFVNAGPLDGVTHASPGTKREPNRLYRNRGDGTFEDVTTQAGVAGAGYGTAVAIGDYDNNGCPDIYLVVSGQNMLYHNRGDGTFEDRTDPAGVGDKGTGISAVWLDVDRDGFLDLFVANYLTFDPNYKLYFQPDGYPGPLSYQPEFNVLYRNRGNGTFEDVSESSGIRLGGHRAMSVSAFDCDNDGDTDLYVSNDATPNLLWVNDGKGRFKDAALRAGVAFNALGEAAGSMAAAIGDCNGDGLSDILVTRLGYGSLYLGTPQGIYDDRMMASGLGSLTAQFVGWGGSFLDFDNDGDLDIFIANGDAHYLVGWESLLLENQGDCRYRNAADKGGAYFKTRVRARGSAVADYDNDGHLDVLVTLLADRAVLLKNRHPSGHHWIALDFEGTRSNRDGYGARVRLSAGGRMRFAEHRCPVGFLSQADRRLHVGLGHAATVERIEIKWPSGEVQTLNNVGADQILKVKEPGARKERTAK